MRTPHWLVCPSDTGNHGLSNMVETSHYVAKEQAGHGKPQWHELFKDFSTVEVTYANTSQKKKWRTPPPPVVLDLLYELHAFRSDGRVASITLAGFSRRAMGVVELARQLSAPLPEVHHLLHTSYAGNKVYGPTACRSAPPTPAATTARNSPAALQIGPIRRWWSCL